MAINGFKKLREKSKFIIKGKNDVIVNFGKYNGSSFSEIGDEDPGYLVFILDTQEEKLSDAVQKRLVYWIREKTDFWV